MKSREWPSVKPVTKNGKPMLLVDCRINKKGERKYFKPSERNAANDYARDQRKLREEQGRGALVSDKWAELARYGWTREKALEFVLDHLRKQNASRFVEDVISSAEDEIQSAGYSAVYLKTFSSRVRALIGGEERKVPGKKLNKAKRRELNVPRNWKGEKISRITTDDLRAFIDAMTSHPQTWNTIRRDLVTLWSRAEKCGWVKGDEAKTAQNLTRKKEIEAEYPVLSVEQTAALLEACRVESVKLAASVAIAAFCPVRAEELARMTWEGSIDAEDGIITINSTIAKKSQRRIIRIPANCLAWLALIPAAERTGKVVPLNRKNMFDRARARAGFKPSFMEKKDTVLQTLIAGKELEILPNNVLRHSAISYAYANTQDITRVANESGNSPDIIRKYYLELVKPSKAALYFGIVPSLSEKEKQTRRLVEVFGKEGAEKILCGQNSYAA